MRTKFESRREQQRIAVGDSYLTGREYQVVAMYIDGYRLSDMPPMLTCSDSTIDSHVRNAKNRIGAKTIHQLIAMTAAADAIRGLGSSNRGPESCSVVAVYSTATPRAAAGHETALSRAL